MIICGYQGLRTLTRYRQGLTEPQTFLAGFSEIWPTLRPQTSGLPSDPFALPLSRCTCPAVCASGPLFCFCFSFLPELGSPLLPPLGPAPLSCCSCVSGPLPLAQSPCPSEHPLTVAFYLLSSLQACHVLCAPSMVPGPG